MQSVDLGLGQAVDLANGYLDVRLTGSAADVRIVALGGDGQDEAEDGATYGDLTLRPGVDRVRIVARPRAGTAFAPGTRIGLDVRVGAGAVEESPQVLVRQLDVGAYTSIDLAHVDHPGSGWRVAAGRVASPSEPVHLVGSAPPEPVDERRLPWIGPGRYALRRARGGSPEHAPTGGAWALVVDGSVSLRPLVQAEVLEEIVELVAGVLVEATGGLPRRTGVTGTLRPRWSTEARENPGRLAEEVHHAARPASWTLAMPSIEQAAAEGAKNVLVVTDGPPADLESVERFAQERPAVTVVFVELSAVDPLAPTPSVAVAVGPPNLRTARLMVSRDQAPGDVDATALAGVLLGGGAGS